MVVWFLFSFEVGGCRIIGIVFWLLYGFGSYFWLVFWVVVLVNIGSLKYFVYGWKLGNRVNGSSLLGFIWVGLCVFFGGLVWDYLGWWYFWSGYW